MTATPPHAQVGLVAHLASPLQSWGERSHFNERDTARFPTRSGVLGLVASALGHSREDDIDYLRPLSLTVRVDRPGTITRDYHTVGGGRPRQTTVATAKGGPRAGATTTLVSHRYYLADAAFTIALTTPAEHAELVGACAAALREPSRPPYLGRRSCPPTAALLIGEFTNPLAHLTALPLAQPQPRRHTTPPVRVTFHSDHPLDWLDNHPPTAASGSHTLRGATPVSEINDDPVSFAPHHRTYRTRPLYTRHITRPTTQCAGRGTDYLHAVTHYLDNPTTTGKTAP